MVLAQLLPSIGVNLGNTELTTVVADLVTVIAAIVAWIRHNATKAQANPGKTVGFFGGIK